MANKKEFTVHLRTKSALPITIPQTDANSNFSFYVRAQKTLALAIQGFFTKATWVIQFRQKLGIAFNPTIRGVTPVFLSLRKIAITAVSRVTSGYDITISLRKIAILSSTKATLKSVVGFVSKLNTTASTKARLKSISPVVINEIDIAMISTGLVYYTLGSYTASTLGTLGGSTLLEMAYTVT